MIPNLSLMRRIPLSVTPYGSGTNIHDWDTLWPMTIMWDLVTILDVPLRFHRINFIVEPLTLSPDPFVIRYFVCPRFDRRYPIPSSSSLLTNIFTRPVILQPRDLVTRLQTLWCNITEWAQSTYPSLGWTNPVLIYFILLNISTSEYPRCTFMVTLLRCNGWYTQSTLIDSDYILSLRSKDRVTTLLSYRNVELCDWITLQHFRCVCVSIISFS